MKYTVEKLGDDLMAEIGDDVCNWDLAHDYFRSDNPTCLDDECPDAFNNWICDEFPNHVNEGVFDKQIGKFLRNKEK